MIRVWRTASRVRRTGEDDDGRTTRRTVRDLRRNNRATVLRKLYFDGPLSRQELGPLTALSSGSISNVVSELVADGLLEEAGSVDSDGGRPRTPCASPRTAATSPASTSARHAYGWSCSTSP